MQTLTKQTFKIYAQHAWRYKLHVIVQVIGILVVVGIEIYQPFLYKRLFDQLVVTTADKAGVLLHIVWLIFFWGMVRHILWRSILFVANYFQPRVMSDLLNTCYEYLQNHSYNFFNSSFVGSLVTKVRRYQSSFEDIADKVFFDFGRTIILITSILVVLWLRHWLLGLLVLVWCAIYAVFNFAFARYKLRYDIERAAADTRTTAHLADTVTNNVNIKLFTSFGPEYRKFKQITDELFRIRKWTWDLSQWSETFQGAFMVLLELAMLYVAVRFWQQGTLTIGDFALIQSYLLHMFDNLWNLGRHIRNLYEKLADANEMTEILLRPHEVTDAPDAGVMKVTGGAIEFNNVLFRYNPTVSIFRRFNLSIAAGERVALIGPSGGGKSTIVKLLFRFMDIQEGQITVDGQDIAQVTQDSLRKYISLVPQEPILFHRSLLENIRYAKPRATEAEVIAAAKAAHAHEFISEFPEGYKTFVGERGVKLSGGERQRVAIARAILKNAPILVLDEATSSLDSESEHYIQDALQTLMKGKTTIVIAHRLSTIMAMDRIVVIENGRIIEQGKHEELLKAKQGTYQRLWQIQAGGFAEATAT